MSSCLFLASDVELPEIIPQNQIIDTRNLENSDVEISKMLYYEDRYSGRKFANEINFTCVCDRQVKQIYDYIAGVMCDTDIVELWNVWVGDCIRPLIRTYKVQWNDFDMQYLREYLAMLENSPISVQNEYEERDIYYQLMIYK